MLKIGSLTFLPLSAHYFGSIVIHSTYCEGYIDICVVPSGMTEDECDKLEAEEISKEEEEEKKKRRNVLLDLEHRYEEVYLPTFSTVVGDGDPPLRIVMMGHWVRQQFSHNFVLFEGF